MANTKQSAQGDVGNMTAGDMLHSGGKIEIQNLFVFIHAPSQTAEVIQNIQQTEEISDIKTSSTRQRGK